MNYVDRLRTPLSPSKTSTRVLTRSGDLAVTRIVVEFPDGLRMTFASPSADIEHTRNEFHFSRFGVGQRARITERCENALTAVPLGGE